MISEPASIWYLTFVSEEVFGPASTSTSGSVIGGSLCVGTGTRIALPWVHSVKWHWPIQGDTQRVGGRGSKSLRTSTGFLRNPPFLLKEATPPFRRSGPPPVPLPNQTLLRNPPPLLKNPPSLLKNLLLFLRASMHHSHRVSLTHVCDAWENYEAHVQLEWHTSAQACALPACGIEWKMHRHHLSAPELSKALRSRFELP